MKPCTDLWLANYAGGCLVGFVTNMMCNMYSNHDKVMVFTSCLSLIHYLAIFGCFYEFCICVLGCLKLGIMAVAGFVV